MKPFLLLTILLLGIGTIHAQDAKLYLDGELHNPGDRVKIENLPKFLKIESDSITSEIKLEVELVHVRAGTGRFTEKFKSLDEFHGFNIQQWSSTSNSDLFVKDMLRPGDFILIYVKAEEPSKFKATFNLVLE